MPTPVTDPDLLAQLNAPARSEVLPSRRVWGDQEAEAAGIYDTPTIGPNITIKPARKPVTDPETLRQLNAPTKQSGDVGQGTAALEGYLSGVSAGFRDEIFGASKASGLPEWLGGFRSPIGAAKLIWEQATGQPGEATAEYERAIQEVRARQKAAQEQYPATYGIGEAVGAIAIPVGNVMQAATLPGRIGRAAAVGSGYGAASGAGEGEDFESRFRGAIAGGAIGGTVGAVAPPLVEGGIQAVRHATRPIRNAIAGAISPERQAARIVGRTLERGIASDPGATSRLTPQEFVAASHGGGPASIVDLGGTPMRRLADWANITSPEGGQILTQHLSQRFEGQGPRIVAWLRNTFNFPNAFAQQRAIEQQARAVNRANYEPVFRQFDGPIWDQTLAELAQDPVVQSAIRRAMSTVQTSRTRAGLRPMNNPFTYEASSGRLTMRRDPNGNPIYPDLRFWDAVKRELDKANTGEANSFARVLREHLDELTSDVNGVSAYQTARSGAAHFFGAQDALEAGQNFVASKMRNDEARAYLARMSPTERQLFQDGFVSRYIETLNEVGDRRSILNKIAETPAARERLSIVLGQQRANELESLLRIEGIMDMARQAVSGNSWTARRLYDLGIIGGTGISSVGAYNTDPTQITIGAIIGAITFGGKRVDQRVAERVARLLVSNDPNQIIRGIQLVARSNNLMNNLRRIDRRIALIGGQQGSEVGAALQIPAITRAEDQQGAPRPPSE